VGKRRRKRRRKKKKPETGEGKREEKLGESREKVGEEVELARRNIIQISNVEVTNLVNATPLSRVKLLVCSCSKYLKFFLRLFAGHPRQLLIVALY
jgi:hypothetical protein